MSLQRQGWQAKVFKWAAALAEFLQRLPNGLAPPPFRLLQIGSAFWQSRALYVAARLDLATTLGDEQLTVAELATRVGADPDALHRLLRLLSACGIFAIDRTGHLANNRLSQPLRADRPGGVRHMVLMHNSPEMSQPWFETLEQGIRSGQVPFDLCHGEELYAHMDRHAPFNALFAQAMDEVDALSGDSFATAFDWRQFDRLIDLGGSQGAKAAAILRRHRHLRAVVVDRPTVIAEARAHWARQGDAACRDRIEFATGDLLQGAFPLSTGVRDAYLLCAVLHGFDDASCEQLLRPLAQHVRASGARIVVLELVLAEHPADLTGASFDMQMFMGTRGRERTLPEWQALFERSGLRLTETVALASFASMLVLQA
ncbi:MAG: methyltransferase [Leptothrix sp. (in: b-proteobacteria)]